MRKLLLLLCITAGLHGLSQNNLLVSYDGIADLKLGMDKASLEKMTGKKFTLKHIFIDGGFYDTVELRHRNADFIIYFSEADSETVATVAGIRSASNLCKTKNGAGVGTAWLQAINLYPKSNVFSAADYDEYPVRSKTRSIVAITADDPYRAIIFHMTNKKTIAIEVSKYFEPG